jgi:hypothetical protein
MGHPQEQLRIPDAHPVRNIGGQRVGHPANKIPTLAKGRLGWAPGAHHTCDYDNSPRSRTPRDLGHPATA